METVNLLICEDERIVALDLEERLTRRGHTVKGIASNGEEAIALAREFTPDLALMDIRLQGGLSGIEIAQVLGDELKIPSIFLTAYSDPALLEKAARTEALGYLIKPVPDDALYAAIEVGISRHRRHLERERGVILPGAGDAALAHLPIASGTERMLRSIVDLVTQDMLRIDTNLRDLASCETLECYERRYLTKAQVALASLTDFIQRLQWMVKEGQNELRFTSLQAILTRALEQVNLAQTFGVTVLPEVTSESLPVLVDQTAVDYAIECILKNAGEASEVGGVVEVRCDTYKGKAPSRLGVSQEIDEYGVIEVRDSGRGISQSLLPQVFDAFFTTKSEVENRGLGLSITCGVIERHGGWIEVESKPASGTCVKLFLPLRHSAPVGSGRNIRALEDLPVVMVVDDDPIVGGLLHDSLMLAGARAQVFTSAADALSWYDDHADEVDLVLLDVEMPLMNGLVCLNEIRKINPEARVAIVSGRDESQVLAELPDIDILRYVQKPFRVVELADWVKNTLGITQDR